MRLLDWFRRPDSRRTKAIQDEQETFNSLKSAVFDGDADRVRQILKSHPNVIRARDDKSLLRNFLDPVGFFAIAATSSVAAMMEILEALLNHGADPNGDSESRPIINAAAISAKGLDAPLEMLLARGADPNAIGPDLSFSRDRSDTGTALIHYMRRGASRPDAVRILLKHGADPTIKDSSGGTAADYCAYDYIKQILTSAISPSKCTVHFLYGGEKAIDATVLKRMARDISKQELPDSCLFFYHVHPWPQAIEKHGLKMIRDAGRYPQGNVAVFHSLGKLTGTLEGVPFACLTLISDFEIKTVQAEDVPEEARRLLGL
jgi:hypothetical protein